MDMSTYVDPGSVVKQTEVPKTAETKPVPGGMFGVTPSDLYYGFVPTDVTQEGKQGEENLRKTTELNLKRFQLGGY
jgi:hypothetical protein